MQVLNLIQGSKEWHAARMQHFCASEAPAMMGLSKYQTRNDLLAMKKTGVSADVSSATQALFDRGHASEAAARPMAEKLIGEDLYPCTGAETIEGMPLLSSFDGLTMREGTTFEHKLFSGQLAAYISKHDDLPDTHWPQVEHQFIVSGASRCLFMTSDGTEENCAWIWYESKPDRRSAVLAGWTQFAADLESYQPIAASVSTSAPVEGLPSVFVQVAGSLSVTDNLAKFGDALRSFIQRTPTKPETDDEFAVCESAIKTLTKAEEALDAAESAALAQVACIDDMRTLKATLKDLARSNRLALEKLVKAEKESRRLAIVTKAQKDLAVFAAAIPEAPYMPTPAADFGSAIKGLKTMTSIQNAVDTELARVKIEADEIARKIRANLDVINEHPEHRAMFADVRALVLKDCDFVALTVKQRIADHVAEIAKREEETRARIQAEEEAKAKAEADRVIEAERAKIRAEEEARAKETAAQSAQEAAPVIAMQAPNISAPAASITQATTSSRGAPSMSIGTISKRMGFTVSREFMSSVGFEGTKDRAAYLYHEEDFRMICSAIADHVMSVANETNQKAD